MKYGRKILIGVEIFCCWVAVITIFFNPGCSRSGSSEGTLTATPTATHNPKTPREFDVTGDWTVDFEALGQYSNSIKGQMIFNIDEKTNGWYTYCATNGDEKVIMLDGRLYDDHVGYHNGYFGVNFDKSSEEYGWLIIDVYFYGKVTHEGKEWDGKFTFECSDSSYFAICDYGYYIGGFHGVHERGVILCPTMTPTPDPEYDMRGDWYVFLDSTYWFTDIDAEMQLTIDNIDGTTVEGNGKYCGGNFIAYGHFLGYGASNGFDITFYSDDTYLSIRLKTNYQDIRHGFTEGDFEYYPKGAYYGSYYTGRFYAYHEYRDITCPTATPTRTPTVTATFTPTLMRRHP